MSILLSFAERLRELLYENGLTAKSLSKELGHNISDIQHWKSGKGKFMPSFSNIVMLADYFKCSMEFLLGLTEQNSLPNPKQQSFSRRFRNIVEEKGYNFYSFSKVVGIGTLQFYRWVKDETQPSIDSLLRVAKALDCSLDYLLGRE